MKLDDLELVDYLKTNGQWTTSVVTDSKPKLEEILNPVAEVDAKGKGKGAPKAAAADNVNFDEADLEILDAPENNVLLGDAIEEIIKINFAERSRLKHPQNPNWLPLKLCLVGYPFAGKKMQAEMIKAKYGLDIYCMEDLVNEAIEFAQANPEPFVNPAEEEKKDEDVKSDVEDYELISEDEEATFNLREEFRLCGVKIQELLLEGDEISDELYVRMFVTKLRMDYEYKSPVQKRREVKQQAKRTLEIKDRLKKIEEEYGQEDLKKKQKKALDEEKEALNQELEQIKEEESRGWVLIDFPCSYAQAKLLEESLSGYKPTLELDPTQRDQQLEEAMLLVQPTAKEEPPKCLIKSGIDAVIWFSLPADECQRRADGRRVDYQTPDVTYHVTDNEPPSDQAPLCERLQPLFQESNHASGIVDRFVSFDLQEKSMTRWLQMFGDEERQRNLLQTIDAGKSKERVFGQIMAIIEEVLDHKRREKMQLREILGFKLQTMMEQKIKDMLAE